MNNLCRAALAAAFLVVSLDYSNAITISTDARPTYDTRLMTIGQSLIDQVTYTAGAVGLTDELISSSVTPKVTAVELIRRAAGGSYACHENDPFAGAGNYWANYNGGAPTAGPLLIAALTDITERLATTPVSNQPTAFIYDQGQQDVLAAAGNVAGVAAGLAATMYDACSKFVFSSLQTAMAGSGPIPIYIMVLGRSCQNTNTIGWDALRKLQLAWLAGGVANTVRVPDSYDMGMYACVHPDRSYVEDYGRRFAYAIANTQYGGAAILGPTIGGLTKPTATTVQVTLVPGAGDTIQLPAGEPWGFDFYDGTTLLTKTWVGWFSGNPRWTIPASTALTGAYISGAGAIPILNDPDKVIRGRTSDIPLQMKYF